MKLGRLASIVITLAWVLNLNAHVQAETKRLIYQSGRQGVSWAVYLLNKKFVKEVELGGETRRLYLVELETDNSDSGVSRQTHLIQCSTSQPFVAFKDDSTSEWQLFTSSIQVAKPMDTTLTATGNIGQFATMSGKIHNVTWHPKRGSWGIPQNLVANRLKFLTH